MNSNKQWVLDYKKIEKLTDLKGTNDEIKAILDKAMELKGISQEEVAKLLNVKSPEVIKTILHTAGKIKQIIYGQRIVLFAPLYTGNVCINDCEYCGFRVSNKSIKRAVLNMEQIAEETKSLLKEGHKRVLMLCGESKVNNFDYFMEAIKTVYTTEWNGHKIRRINVEIAPLTVEEFRILKTANIGTYACFQETYHPQAYARYHKKGPKSDYLYRLNAMHRAMEGGIDDVGIGVLFGLHDFRFEVLSIIEHAASLEEHFGCGPHTVSVPRIEPAVGVDFTEHIPHAVNDEEFSLIIAVLRIALPYTGIILSTRESEALRNQLFKFGVSQISAGSRTNPGAYAEEEEAHHDPSGGSQFSLGDHRSLSEVIARLVEEKYIPSFCTGCYRKGRVGNDFMDLAKPGLIHKFCMPNGLFTFKEYLEDFAPKELQRTGSKLIDEIITSINNENLQTKVADNIKDISNGKRDIYF